MAINGCRITERGRTGARGPSRTDDLVQPRRLARHTLCHLASRSFDPGLRWMFVGDGGWPTCAAYARHDWDVDWMIGST